MAPPQNTPRVAHGHFAPGQSGNPGGRPKGHGSFREAAAEYTAEALETLVALMR